MAVGDENVLPAVVIEVEKLYAKGKKRNTDWPKVRRASHVGEFAVVVVVVEVVAVVGKIRLNDVGPAVVVVIGGVNAHAGLFFAVGAVGCAGLSANFRESALAIIVVEHAGRGIVGDVKIEAAVAVVVEPDDAQSVIGVRINVQLFSDVTKSAVAVVVIKAVASTSQATRPARNRDSSILAEWAFAKFRQVFEIEIDVVNDVKVEIAVVVVIAECRAGSPTAFVPDTGFLGDIGEGSVAIVAVEHAA